MDAAELRARLGERGFDCVVTGIEVLASLRDSFQALESGPLDRSFAEERLGFFKFGPPADFPQARSIIVAAMRLPSARVWFHWKGRRVPVPVPPGYVGYEQAGRTMEEAVTGLLAPAGFRIAPVLLPEKALAVRAGLARYGANNVVYVPGMGSLLRLVTFYSDLPAGEASWREPQALVRCATCRSCERACPTGAIAKERFLLHAERCIVFHNERPSTVAFPDWIPPAAHECLVGCMECQRACPENLPFLGSVVEAGEYSEAETGLILEGRAEQDLPPQLRARLLGSDLLCQLHVLPRNLRAALSRAVA